MVHQSSYSAPLSQRLPIHLSDHGSYTWGPTVAVQGCASSSLLHSIFFYGNCGVGSHTVELYSYGADHLHPNRNFIFEHLQFRTYTFYHHASGWGLGYLHQHAHFTHCNIYRVVQKVRTGHVFASLFERKRNFQRESYNIFRHTLSMLLHYFEVADVVKYGA